MKNHTKVYFKAFGYDTNSWIGCEVCGATAVDIHHIESRGMGGSKHADTIENLMALCRECHVEFGDKKHYKELLVATHAMRLNRI
jgi:5-methylcytosine-specific restriction endonuclease McrA